MRVTVERLRRWFLLGIVLLILAVVSVIGVARWKTRGFLHNLPKQLGADIRSSTNGFTYSQSLKGRTIFTIHASKAIQRQDGKTTLHDVSILLYGNGAEGKAQRTDRIEGSEFEYDQANGIVRAMGEVHIDLQSPDQADTAQQAREGHDGHIHLKTSGLVFTEKDRVATTGQLIEIQQDKTHGSAVGAEYNATTGLLKLYKDVQMQREDDGQRSILHAGYTEIDRAQKIARLQHIRFERDDRTLTADTGVATLRADGSPETIHADGNVVLAEGEQMTVRAPHAVADVTAAHKPSVVHLLGGVVMQGDEGNGEAQTADLRFDDSGSPKIVAMQGNVHLSQVQEKQQRDMSAPVVEIALERGSDQKVEAKQVKASQGAHLKLRDDAAKRPSTRVFSADVITGTFAMANGKQYLQHSLGTGHSVMEETFADGETRRSVSDSTEVWLSAPQGRKAEDAVQRIVQQGSVQMASHQPADAKRRKAAVDSHAVASRVEYEGATNMAVLTGSPHLEGDGMGLSATQVSIAQRTGDVTADGDVRVSYDSGSQQGPMHVTAKHGELHRATNTAVFTGDANARVRLWQGASQLEAPRIEMDRTAQILRAHSDAKWNVRMVFPSDAAKGDSAKSNQGASTAIVTGADLVYRGTGSVPTAHLTGGTQVRQAEGTVNSDTLTAVWKSAKNAGAAKNANGDLFGGALDTLTAEGNVKLRQQGRNGTGEHLLYTATTRDFVLTGTPQAPPVLTDSVQGTLTGGSLRFRAGENSIVVTAAPGKRVHAETRVER